MLIEVIRAWGVYMLLVGLIVVIVAGVLILTGWF